MKTASSNEEIKSNKVLMKEDPLLKSAISEYENLLSTIAKREPQQRGSECLVRELCRSHDWTDEGARAIVSLANNYGAFMLRNALGLAIALGIEDGEINF